MNKWGMLSKHKNRPRKILTNAWDLLDALRSSARTLFCPKVHSERTLFWPKVHSERTLFCPKVHSERAVFLHPLGCQSDYDSWSDCVQERTYFVYHTESAHLFICHSFITKIFAETVGVFLVPYIIIQYLGQSVSMSLSLSILCLSQSVLVLHRSKIPLSPSLQPST